MLNDLLLDWQTLPPANVIHVYKRSVLGISFFSEVKVLFLRTGDPERIDVQCLREEHRERNREGKEPEDTKVSPQLKKRETHGSSQVQGMGR